MFDHTVPTDQSRILAELLDAALADRWNESGPTMALLWQASDDPDDLRIAVKVLEQPVDDELALLEPGWAYLAVAHSAVTSDPPPELCPGSAHLPVRVTVAVDEYSQAGVVRHRNGSTEWFGDQVELALTKLLRSELWFEPAAECPPYVCRR